MLRIEVVAPGPPTLLCARDVLALIHSSLVTASVVSQRTVRGRPSHGTTAEVIRLGWTGSIK
ncbi:hypothetical protein CBOM_07466 [Ceraceosorus bombacis]|uniref:Uncharacterized protein n=1 Tax=Ceraceosorus bombacis TaxID=401625 RepID=A0A0P1BEC6_9BASI|nr:hypothetical protein CBOM_07466 [Ceraceosorus bombacis]